MAAITSCPGAYNLIFQMVVNEKRSHKYVSEKMKRMFPHLSRGLSIRSIRRYCAAKNIHSTSRLPDYAIETIVKMSVDRVCFH